MLTHPLFRSEFYPTAALCVPDLLLRVLGVLSGAYIKGRKIQFIHFLANYRRKDTKNI